MATHDDWGVSVALSHAQAMEVAKRFNPAPGRVLWFADDGALLGEEARSRGWKIVPVCGYAAAWLRGSKTYRDLVA